MKKYICIHGHFYQPPRENPWLEAIELQDSAYPFHNWNERITAECYGPNTASRILDQNRKILNIVNNYAHISFNFGPTLLSWLELRHPRVHERILQADARSRELHNGHGSAIAQAYNHMIMPLANTRDKRTQVIWGIRDFTSRFGHDPEGMWLPETAVDVETLEILAEHGITFTILSPYQANRVREIGGSEWRDVKDGKIDPKMPYRCNLPSGRSIILFFYDGPISNAIAFEGLLKDGQHFADRLYGAFSEPSAKEKTGKKAAAGPAAQLVHIATDGESYGHHHRYGDMALAYCDYLIESGKTADMTVYGEYLEMFPPTQEVEIIENTSWSCYHGVERWRSNCGCNTGGHPDWTQEWRKPLREGLDSLRDELSATFEQGLSTLMSDPWKARDEYIEVILDRSDETVTRFLTEHAGRELSKEESITALKFLEMQRHAMLMFTSCGWFFDEISGIETVQVLQYASRAMQLACDLTGNCPEERFLETLATAPSNIPQFGDGRSVYEQTVKPAVIGIERVGAHYAISSLFEEYQQDTDIYCYYTQGDRYDLFEMGINRLAIGAASIHSEITREESGILFAVLHFGGHNLLCGITSGEKGDQYDTIIGDIRDEFQRGNIPEVIRLIDDRFPSNYTLYHLFRDEQRKVLDQILESSMADLETSYRMIFEYRYPVMLAMHDLRIPFPQGIAAPVEFILNTDIRRALEHEYPDLRRLRKLAEQINALALEPDKALLNYVAQKRINLLMSELRGNPRDINLIKNIEELLTIMSDLSLDLDLWESQNCYFAISKDIYENVKREAESGDEKAKEWIEHFESLGAHFNISGVNGADSHSDI